MGHFMGLTLLIAITTLLMSNMTSTYAWDIFNNELDYDYPNEVPSRNLHPLVLLKFLKRKNNDYLESTTFRAANTEQERVINSAAEVPAGQNRISNKRLNNMSLSKKRADAKENVIYSEVMNRLLREYSHKYV